MASSSSMSSWSSNAMSWRRRANASRMASPDDHLPDVIDLLQWLRRRMVWRPRLHREVSWSLVSSRILGYHHHHQARSTYVAAGVNDRSGRPTEVWCRHTASPMLRQWPLG